MGQDLKKKLCFQNRSELLCEVGEMTDEHFLKLQIGIPPRDRTVSQKVFLLCCLKKDSYVVWDLFLVISQSEKKKTTKSGTIFVF